mmetsp:Transcript_33923/g.82260  ORF Transcript_33923/g.82260 Transcript_33923/m.82260 type:complete len:353 (+) Transcript_33923:825-1883(+)
MAAVCAEMSLLMTMTMNGSLPICTMKTTMVVIGPHTSKMANLLIPTTKMDTVETLTPITFLSSKILVEQSGPSDLFVRLSPKPAKSLIKVKSRPLLRPLLISRSTRLTVLPTATAAHLHAVRPSWEETHTSPPGETSTTNTTDSAILSCSRMLNSLMASELMSTFVPRLLDSGRTSRTLPFALAMISLKLRAMAISVMAKHTSGSTMNTKVNSPSLLDSQSRKNILSTTSASSRLTSTPSTRTNSLLSKSTRNLFVSVSPEVPSLLESLLVSWETTTLERPWLVMDKPSLTTLSNLDTNGKSFLPNQSSSMKWNAHNSPKFAWNLKTHVANVAVGWKSLPSAWNKPNKLAAL